MHERDTAVGTAPPLGAGVVDLLVVGGGINGVGIARDAAGRGLSVLLAERADLGSATSSASSKLVHGGLRYLEQFELRLVAEALAEREVLLRAAPHLVRPLRFVMPRAPGVRPDWMIRAGLLLYDRMARRHTLPASRAIDLQGMGLKPEYHRGYSYSDCWVDDARLVIANAVCAREHGASIMPRTAFVAARRENGSWRATLKRSAGDIEVGARAIVNAAGPWVLQVLGAAAGDSSAGLKLVQGSHIVVERLFEGDHAFILQNDDRRVVFACPYEGSYTLIGTTDVGLNGGPRSCDVTAAEISYLCRAANRYFNRQVAPADVKWSYCGVRALYDDGETNPADITRDYRLHLEADGERTPLLSVFGGKITTYRRLAERALARLTPFFPRMGPAWTEHARLPGGDFPERTVDEHCGALSARYSRLPADLIRALVARHGDRTVRVLGSASLPADLGSAFGHHLYGREIDYFVAHEWARSAEDVLWRRTKAGLHLDPDARERVGAYVRSVARDA
jgi:glycerol-3-phosphate dehydrogenase